jgi:hypothetical protein
VIPCHALPAIKWYKGGYNKNASGTNTVAKVVLRPGTMSAIRKHTKPINAIIAKYTPPIPTPWRMP